MIPAVLLTVIGAALGLAFGGLGAHEAQVQPLIRNLALGFVWAFVLLQWVDLVGQALALLSDPVESTIDFGDKSAVQETAAGMKQSPEVMSRMAHLLHAWSQSLSPQALIELAAFQSSRALKPVSTGTVFGLVVLYAVGFSSASPVLVWGGGVLLGLTLLAKVGLLSRIDAYIESRILSRLPGNLPNTTMTAEALGGAIGHSIETAFDQYIPKPQELAAAIQGGVNEASKAIAEQAQLIAKTLEDVKAGLAASLSGSGQEMAAQLAQVQSTLQSSLHGAGKEAVDQLTAALASQSDRLEATSASLVSQIEQLVQLESNIQNLLNVQNSIDAAIEGMAASTQWQETLNALTTHLAESDKLLKEVAKPRMITLVEEG